MLGKIIKILYRTSFEVIEFTYTVDIDAKVTINIKSNKTFKHT